jgi:hypothetical protein
MSPTINRESVKAMRRVFCFGILGVLFAVPVHAQRGAGGNPNVNSTGGGGGVGSGGAGSSNFHILSPVPPAQFQMLEFSGSETVTSSFVPFEKGIALGQAELNATHQTLVEVAAEKRHSERAKAKFVIMQDGTGRARIERQ